MKNGGGRTPPRHYVRMYMRNIRVIGESGSEPPMKSINMHWSVVKCSVLSFLEPHETGGRQTRPSDRGMYHTKKAFGLNLTRQGRTVRQPLCSFLTSRRPCQQTRETQERDSSPRESKSLCLAATQDGSFIFGLRNTSISLREAAPPRQKSEKNVYRRIHNEPTHA